MLGVEYVLRVHGKFVNSLLIKIFQLKDSKLIKKLLKIAPHYVLKYNLK